MIYFRTKVPELAVLRFSRLKSNVKRFKHIARIDSFNSFVCVGVNDALYMTGFQDGPILTMSEAYESAVMRALQACGLITKDVAEAYADEQAEIRKRRELDMAAYRLEESAEALGIKLTKSQLAKIRK